MVVGVSVAEANVVPVIAIVLTPPTMSSIMVTEPDWSPVVVAFRFTVTTQLAPAAKVAGERGQVSDRV